MWSLPLLLATAVGAGAVSSPNHAGLQPVQQPLVLMESSAKSQARADIFVPSVVRVLAFLQSSMSAKAEFSPSSVKDYKILLDNCQVALADVYPSSFCNDLADVHKDGYKGKPMFTSPNLSLIAKDLSAFLETQDSNVAKVAADVKDWVGTLQDRVKSVGGTLFHQDGVSHSGVAMQLAMLCAQLPESHANPTICTKFVAAYNTMFKNEDIFSPQGGSNSAFISTLVSIIVQDSKEHHSGASAPRASSVHHQKQSKLVGTSVKFVEKQPLGNPHFDSYASYKSARAAQLAKEHELMEKGVAKGAPKTKGGFPSTAHPISEVDQRGVSTVPDEPVVVQEGGMDVPLSFRLGYPTIANRALDLEVFKTQVREDCAFALNVTDERFAVLSVEPSFNNRYVNVVLRLYPIMYNNPPTVATLLANMKRQIVNEVSPLRLGIATRHLFIPGDTSAKAFRESYVRALPDDNSAGRDNGKFFTTSALSLTLVLYMCAVFV